MQNDASTAARSGTACAEPDLRAQIAKLVENEGLPAAARKLELNASTIAKLCGGLPVRRSSLTVARLRLAPPPSSAPSTAA